MPIFLTGYDTLAGRGYNIGPVKQAAQHAMVRTNFADNNCNLNNVDLGGQVNPAVAIVTTLTDDEMSIPPFVFPMLVELPGVNSRRSNSYVLTDVRPYLSSNKVSAGNELVIRHKDNYDMFLILGLLTTSWANENKRNSFKFLGTAPMAVYAALISNALERRFSLDPAEQLKISIVSAAFYAKLFVEDSTYTENDKVTIARNIASATRAPSEMVFAVLDQIETMKNLSDLIDTIKVVIDNPRLEALNLGTLVTIINSMWYGPYGKELIVAALEHPPTWVTILYSAFVDRGMKHSGVARVSERFKGGKGGDDFIRHMKVLVSSAKT